MTAITFLLVLSVIVLAHELGHFFVALRAGVHVEEFGIGFPPRLWGVKRGRTLYSINAVPIGGFVRLKGESGEDHGPHSFGGKSVLARGLIIVAGVVMNFVLAWALLSFGYAIGMPQAIDDESAVPSYVTVSDRKIYVMNVLDGSPAGEAGLKVGDAIVAVGGAAVGSVETFSGITGERAGAELALTVERAGEAQQISVITETLSETGKPGIGVGLLQTGMVRYPILLAPIEGLSATVSFTREIVVAFARIIGELVSGSRPSVDVSGPVGIAVVTGEVAQQGFRHLLQFVALLSINLGVINVLPLPALDGGRLFFLLIERLRGRAVGMRLENAIHNAGFALLILLVIVVTYGDVVKFGDRILRALAGVFN